MTPIVEKMIVVLLYFVSIAPDIARGVLTRWRFALFDRARHCPKQAASIDFCPGIQLVAIYTVVGARLFTTPNCKQKQMLASA